MLLSRQINPLIINWPSKNHTAKKETHVMEKKRPTDEPFLKQKQANSDHKMAAKQEKKIYHTVSMMIKANLMYSLGK